MRQRVVVIGGGLAGSEAALQIARQGVAVELYEMRPVKMTEAHTTPNFAELVCSNSFGSDSPHSASRMLKDEIEKMGAFLLRAARNQSVPAGASLAVDREKFSAEVAKLLEENPLITVKREEVKEIPNDAVCVIATGPLTSKELCQSLCTMVGEHSLYFYDAISPIVSSDSLDMSKLFLANRYGKGETPDFLNVPLNKEQYDTLVNDLLTGEVMLPHDFEEAKYFEGCLPIETIASRGHQTLAFGPMKPVGLDDPKTGRRPYAVVQLRTENQFKTAYNLVGFQTKLKYKEQERIFRKLPGLENAEFLRLGSMHRNTYLHSPRLLEQTLQLRKNPNVLIAGQLTGTEGYLESTATGLLAGLNAARIAKNEPCLTLPGETMLGALLTAITDRTKTNFQPINSNIGILPPSAIPFRKDKKARNAFFAERAQANLSQWMVAQNGGL